MTQITTIGRRHYIDGAPYAARDLLRTNGCKWDPERKAWWTGTRETAETLLTQLADGAADGEANDAPGRDAVVAGKAEYKGRTYYLAGRVVEGRRVEVIQARDGSRALLYFRDGSRQFWAPVAALKVQRYTRARTIAELADYAARVKAAADAPATDQTRCISCGAPASGCSMGPAGFAGGFCYDCQ